MANMDPFAGLPTAARRSSRARTVNFRDPRPGGPVMVAAPRATAVTEHPGTDVVKPLRSEKEPLPVADAVDPKQVLRPARGYPVEAPAGPAGPPSPPAAPIVTFDAGVFGNPSTIPPDTAGAVNRDMVFGPHNNRVWLQGRNGEAVGDVTLDAFWNVFGRPIDTFDPKVVYDPLTQRFIFVTCANAERADSSILVAISAADDPNGAWQFGEITVDQAVMGPIWFDYPSLGFTADKITVGVNLFSLAGNQFRGVAVFAIDKAGFLDPPHAFVFDQFVMDDQGGTHAPALVLDPGVTDQYLLTTWTGNFEGSGFLALYRLTGQVAAGTTDLQRVGFLEVGATWQAFAPMADFAPQQGTSTRINAGDNRMQWVVHRHGQLYAAHTVFVPFAGTNRSAVQWHEVSLTGTPAITARGLIEDPAGDSFYAYPSLAVNAQRDVLIGMAAFSAGMFASGAYSLRLNGGVFEAPEIFAPGENTYVLTFGGSRNRWGDYSATMVDPANDLDFWTIQEYARAQANTWGTRWARIPMAPPPVA